ncbi:MAG: hypothetical protein LC749_01240 [Actinobacteria bacterium]|nr:hypothetical protein [Actinomycetota bacterium]
MTLTASPDANSGVAAWGSAGVACGRTPTCTLTMSQPLRVTAFFPRP